MGDAIPSVEVFEGEPGKKVNLAELFKGKKGVLFGVPGAFTPGCSKVRLLVSRFRNWNQACGGERGLSYVHHLWLILPVPAQ